MSNQLDTVGWFICTLHQLIGHRATANFIGMPEGDVTDCILCRYENGVVTKAEVIERMGTAES